MSLQPIARRTLLGSSLVAGGLAALGPRAFADGALNLAPLPKGETRDVKIAIGGTADATHIAVYYAVYNGTFAALKKDGINVIAVPFGSGTDWLLSLTSGQTQMAHGYFENIVRAHAQGRDTVQVYDVLPTPGLQTVVGKAMMNTIKSVKDAAGKRWGITGFGSATHAVSLRACAHYGVDPNSVHWTPVGGNTGYLPSIRDNRVDLETCDVSAGSILIGEGSAKLLIDMADPKTVSEIWPGGYLGLGIQTSAAYAAKEPFVVYKVLTAIRDTVHMLKTQSAEDVAKKLPSEFHDEALVPTLKVITHAMANDGTTDLKVAASMIADMNGLKLGKAGLPPSAVVDNRFADKLRTSA